MILVIALGAFISTMLGGLFALKFQDQLHLILGFSAGSVIGVAFFDLLPEALQAGDVYPAATITSTIAVGFLIYLVLDRFVFVYASEKHSEDGSRRGHLGAATLTIHSWMDGIAVGLAFQISTQIGLVVAVAVLVHDFSDGINTVNIVTAHGWSRRHAAWWLILDAAAPVVGVLSTFFFSIPKAEFGRVLAVFCGFFLYIGAADLLPESQHAHPTRLTTLATLSGVGLLYIVIKWVA
jgi:zinc transporter ZupT